ncbi:unnamed protein product [Nesidiocoris tenuis]|uniref:Uncharacterized protein n=1 Tax=Nesidiocoris tenuis TaxID=355587 RepID=A0A6H5G2K7_9HEMI|nr:unnamed protein product [Nesidiocoris tenuis]
MVSLVPRYDITIKIKEKIISHCRQRRTPILDVSLTACPFRMKTLADQVIRSPFRGLGLLSKSLAQLQPEFKKRRAKKTGGNPDFSRTPFRVPFHETRSFRLIRAHTASFATYTYDFGFRWNMSSDDVRKA